MHLSGMNNILIPGYLTAYVLLGAVAVVGTVILGLRFAPGPRSRARWTVSALLVAWFFGGLNISH